MSSAGSSLTTGPDSTTTSRVSREPAVVLGAEAAAGEARVTFLEGDPGGDLKLASRFRPLRKKITFGNENNTVQAIFFGPVI